MIYNKFKDLHEEALKELLYYSVKGFLEAIDRKQEHEIATERKLIEQIISVIEEKKLVNNH
jgi:hypothetical protein